MQRDQAPNTRPLTRCRGAESARAAPRPPLRARGRPAGRAGGRTRGTASNSLALATEQLSAWEGPAHHRPAPEGSLNRPRTTTAAPLSKRICPRPHASRAPGVKVGHKLKNPACEAAACKRDRPITTTAAARPPAPGQVLPRARAAISLPAARRSAPPPSQTPAVGRSRPGEMGGEGITTGALRRDGAAKRAPGRRGGQPDNCSADGAEPTRAWSI